LSAVERAMAIALRESERDVEHVHQLRVGTRRAGQALKVFVDCLPKKVSRRVGKGLKQVRRAAGQARDCDVFSATLADCLQKFSAHQRPGLVFLLGVGQERRRAAQEQLIAAGDIDLQKLRHNTLANLCTPAKCFRLRDLAHETLGDLYDELAMSAEQTSEGEKNPASFHSVRILGKKLRYAMELFFSCFPLSFRRDVYP